MAAKPDVPPRLLAEELDRILQSRTFTQTKRQGRFLRFIVDETIAGRGEGLKEYVIGVEVFEKPDSFDPRIDSIVRVEAARLRAKLRTYYSEEGQNDPVIVEVAPRGYRPTWMLRHQTKAAPDPPLRRTGLSSLRSPLRERSWRLAAGTALLLAASLALVTAARRPALIQTTPGIPGGSAPPVESVAVFPFESGHSGGLIEELRQGILDEIVSSLSSSRRLRIASAPHRLAPAPAAGAALGVDALVTGSIHESNGRIRVTANVIRCTTGEYLWSGTFERSGKEVFPLRDEVALGLRGFLIPGTALGPAGSNPGGNASAYKEYAEGRHFLGQRSPKSLEKAVVHFQRAIALDPDNARAYAGLASAHSVLGRVTEREPRDYWPVVKWAASKALERDGRLAEAHTRLAGVLSFYEWRWQEAEPLFRRAIENEPGNADAHHNYAHFLISNVRLNEALRQMQAARDLDPVSAIVAAHVGLVYYMMGQYDRAVAEYRRAIELSPGFYRGNFELARVYMQKDMPREAMAELEKARPGFSDQTKISAWLAACQARLGQPTEGRRLLASERLSAFDRAVIAWGFQDRHAALHWLEEATAARSIWTTDLNVDPMHAWLRSDSRFQALLGKMGLPARHTSVE